ncbi:MAG TPA: alpha/beta fold hydrolase [Dehalococcoidia bacterium]|nr:alpha/beta fold hydrolase [Dehalococcoidia bacterium]
MPLAAVNGIQLYYESQGKGPAIVFAHGAGGNHMSWWQQVPVFSANYRCVTFDHRAFGQSLDSTGGGRAQFAADVLELLDQLDIDRFVFVAQSMGGRTAAGLIRRAPQRLRGVIFAGSTAGSVSDEVRELQRRHTASLPAGSTLLERALWPRYAEANPCMAFLYRQINRLNPKRPADFLALQPGYRGTFSPFLAECGVPILFLVGEHDAITPPHIVQRAAALVPHAEYQMIAGAGHSAYFERPEAFNAAVLGFVQRVEAIEAKDAGEPPEAAAAS